MMLAFIVFICLVLSGGNESNKALFNNKRQLDSSSTESSEEAIAKPRLPCRGATLYRRANKWDKDLRFKLGKSRRHGRDGTKEKATSKTSLLQPASIRPIISVKHPKKQMLARYMMLEGEDPSEVRKNDVKGHANKMDIIKEINSKNSIIIPVDSSKANIRRLLKK